MRIADPKVMLGYVEIKASSHVGDFGAGAGAYSKLVADMLDESGELLVIDALPGMVEKVVHELEKTSRARVFGISHDIEKQLPITVDSLDVAIVANVLHALHPQHRQDFIFELSRVLRPAGQALVVDWAGSFKNMGPAQHLVAAPADVVRMFKAAGFKVSGMLSGGAHHFVFTATAPTQNP